MKKIPVVHSDPTALAEEITELAGHLTAGEYRFLALVEAFDRERGWEGEGIHSCAHWLNWRCGLSLGVAREKVRVARALPELPKISAAFAEGRVSYSKVRAMTRAATPDNEAALLNTALHGNASYVERQVRLYRKYKRREALAQANARHAHRELSWRVDDSGCWVLRGRLSPEQGSVIATASTCTRISKRSRPTATASRRISTTAPTFPRKRRAGSCRFPGCCATRCVDAHHVRHWADGGETRMENLVLLCRRHHRLVHEGGFELEAAADGEFRFFLPDGRYLPPAADGHSRGNGEAIRSANIKAGLHIDARTAVPDWGGEAMDGNLAVLELVQLE